MHKIRGWLYIGNFADTMDTALLRGHNIGAILQLAGHSKPPGMTILHLPVTDGESQTPENLDRGIAFIRAQKAEGKIVMSACAAGISRSTTYALGALKAEEGGSLLDLLMDIKRHHPHALPHIRLWHSLGAYYDEAIPYQQIWTAKRKRR
jgi:hypothetical protein